MFNVTVKIFKAAAVLDQDFYVKRDFFCNFISTLKKGSASLKLSRAPRPAKTA